MVVEGTAGETSEAEDIENNTQSGKEFGEKALLEKAMGAEEVNSCPIKITDFTFMGLPINEISYEECKSLLGYTADDTSDVDNTQEASFGGTISCVKDKYIALQHEIEFQGASASISYIVMSCDNHFRIMECPEKMDVINSFYKGPIQIGMTLEEVKLIFGYDETKCQSFETYKIMNYSDGGFMRLDSNGGIAICLSDGHTITTIIENNVVKGIGLYFDAE